MWTPTRTPARRLAFAMGSALDCVLAQRLARRLCTRCKEPYLPSEHELMAAHFPWLPGEPVPELHRPVGCSACAKTGYKGRLALHEVMTVTEGIERLAVSHASGTEIGEVAIREGMTTLRNDGWAKVIQGVTSIEEILRVVA
jgi:type IV pilus assembly protein PilB